MIGCPIEYLKNCIYRIKIELKKPIKYTYNGNEIEVKELTFRLVHCLDVIIAEFNRLRKVYEMKGKEFSNEEILNDIIRKFINSVEMDEKRYDNKIAIRISSYFFVER